MKLDNLLTVTGLPSVLLPLLLDAEAVLVQKSLLLVGGGPILPNSLINQARGLVILLARAPFKLLTFVFLQGGDLALVNFCERTESRITSVIFLFAAIRFVSTLVLRDE